MSITMKKMETTKPVRLFLNYLLPSLFGMMLMAMNTLVDGLFVSHGVGELALAGVNITLPVYSILFSLSLWFGMGGATMYSVALGRGEIKRAQHVFSQSIIITVVVTIVFTIVSLMFERQLSYFFGATETIYPYVIDYLHVLLLYGFVYPIENILSIFIRNDGNPILATTGLIINAILNIVLDYIFIFPFGWGVKGAAYATIIATAIGIGVLLLHFLKKERHLKFQLCKMEVHTILSMMGIGLPSFIVEATLAVTTIATNIAFKHFVGDVGITAYAIVNYVHGVFMMIFIGVGASLQPIASFHYGAKLYDRLRTFLRIAVWTGFGVGMISFLISLLGSDMIIDAFAIKNEEVITYTKKGIMLFFLGYLFFGMNMVYAQYYQSIEQVVLSASIIIMKSLVLFLPSLWILPTFFGQDALWLAFPIVEAVTFTFIYLIEQKRRSRNSKFVHG